MSIVFESQAKPRSSTAPSAIASRDGCTSGNGLEQIRSQLSPHSFGIVKDHADGVAMTGADTAYAMAQVDPIRPARPLDGTVTHRKDHRITLRSGTTSAATASAAAALSARTRRR